MIRYIFLISVCCFLFACTTEPESEIGQSPVFTKFYGTVNTDEAYAIIESNDGGIVILATNETELAEETIFKIHAIKIDTDGNVVWDKLYPDFSDDLQGDSLRINYSGKAIARTDNGYIIVGDSIYNEEETCLLLVAINEEGDLVNTNTICDNEGHLAGEAIERGNNGNLVVLARLIDNEEPENMYLTEVNSALDPQWSQTYGIGDEAVVSKSVYVGETSITWSGSVTRINNESDMRVISTPPNSKNTFFDETYGINNGSIEIGLDIVKTPIGYIITGTTDNTSTGNTDVYLLSISESGQQLWSKNFGGPGDEIGNAVSLTTNNEIVVFGSTNSFGAGETDLFVFKTNLSGNVIWGIDEETNALLKTFGGLNEEIAADLLTTEDAIYLLGTVDFGDVGSIILIKTDKEGNL